MAGMRDLLTSARPFVNRRGYDIVRYPGARLGHRRNALLKRLGTDLVLDVGANVGQYGRELRTFGYSGHIRSFEPMSQAYAELSAVAEADGNWSTVRSAVGSESGTIEIHVAGNSISSSILPMADRHAQVAPVSVYQGSEEVPVDRLDQMVGVEFRKANAPLLKVDTQGYEAVVLSGAAGISEDIAALELELSLVELYSGQELMPEMLDRVASLGYRLAILDNGLWDEATGETLQINALFVRAAWGSL